MRDQIPNAHVTSSRPQVYWKDDGFQEVRFIGRMMVFRRFVLYYTVHGNEKDSSQAEGGVGSDSIDAIQVFSWLRLFVQFIS